MKWCCLSTYLQARVYTLQLCPLFAPDFCLCCVPIYVRHVIYWPCLFEAIMLIASNFYPPIFFYYFELPQKRLAGFPFGISWQSIFTSPVISWMFAFLCTQLSFSLLSLSLFALAFVWMNLTCFVSSAAMMPWYHDSMSRYKPECYDLNLKHLSSLPIIFTTIVDWTNYRNT